MPATNNTAKNPFRATGYLCISNHGGYEIETSRDGNAARVRINSGDKTSPHPRWQEIKYDSKGDPFVTFKGRRLRLDKFMRV